MSTDNAIPLVSVLTGIIRHTLSRIPPAFISPENHLEFIQYLEEVVQRIKSSKDWEKVAEHKVGLALETLFHGQQSVITALQQLYTEVQQSGKISNDRASQYWNNLENLHNQVHQHQKTQEERIAEALRQEGERRTAVEGEIVREVTRIRTNMQEFVNRQLPGWIQEGVAFRLSRLPPTPQALTLEDIREVIGNERPKENPFLEQVAKEKEKREGEIPRERVLFEKWMKEQMAKAEEEMEKRLLAKQLGSRPATIWEEDEGGPAGEDRLSQWVSQIPQSINPEVPPSP
jgi:hypothetical protein